MKLVMLFVEFAVAFALVEVFYSRIGFYDMTSNAIAFALSLFSGLLAVRTAIKLESKTDRVRP